MNRLQAASAVFVLVQKIAESLNYNPERAAKIAQNTMLLFETVLKIEDKHAETLEVTNDQ